MFNENGPISDINETQNEIFKAREANQISIATRQLKMNVEATSWQDYIDLGGIDYIERYLQYPAGLENMQDKFENSFLPRIIIAGFLNPEYEDRAIEMHAMWLKLDSYKESKGKFDDLIGLYTKVQRIKNDPNDFRILSVDGFYLEKNAIEKLKEENNQDEYYTEFLKTLRKYNNRGEYLKVIKENDEREEAKSNISLKTKLMNLVGKLIHKSK